MTPTSSEAVAGALTVERIAASEQGAWSNAYLLSDGEEALLFDVHQMHTDAIGLADLIQASGKKLRTVWISHAHPDHFMGLDVIVDRFPDVQVLSTSNVIADLRADGPWMLDVVKQRLGAEAADRLIEPAPLQGPILTLGESTIEIVEYGPGEAKHHACFHLPDRRAVIASDVIYNGAHAYLYERNLDGWLVRLDELEQFTAERGVHTIYPGHGQADGLSLIAATREYLTAFAEAVESGDAETACDAMISRFPDYHALPFLTAFSLPAYFPPTQPDEWLEEGGADAGSENLQGQRRARPPG